MQLFPQENLGNATLVLRPQCVSVVTFFLTASLFSLKLTNWYASYPYNLVLEIQLTLIHFFKVF